MRPQLKPLAEQVIVITGATSGIGLATARAAAEAGAKLVLAARNKSALESVAKELRRRATDVVYVMADVGKFEDVEKIAQAAMQYFGHFDTWVNNAGVSIFGPLQEISVEDHRKLFETNFWGIVYGSLVAAKHLKNRGGAIINLGSVASDMAIPLQGMYSASKHAVRGFTDALRMELQRENAPISMTLIKPTSINTPFPGHAKNYTNQEMKLPGPLYTPEEVATAILHAATHVDRDLYIGGSSRLMSFLNQLAPAAMDWISRNVLAPQQFRPQPNTQRRDALHQAGEDGEVSGDAGGMVMPVSLYTRSVMHPWMTVGIVSALGLLATLALTSHESDSA